jgi:quercetin dioxygenase-like cupin family protein
MSAQRDRRVKAGELANLAGIAAAEAGRGGVIWTLEASDDLNANLVRFPAGEGVGEHVNDEVDVIFVGISGSGFISVDGGTRLLSCGTLVFVPKGARRSTRSATGRSGGAEGNILVELLPHSGAEVAGIEGLVFEVAEGKMTLDEGNGLLRRMVGQGFRTHSDDLRAEVERLERSR